MPSAFAFLAGFGAWNWFILAALLFRKAQECLRGLDVKLFPNPFYDDLFHLFW